MNMEFKRKMPTPQAIKEMYPITPELAERKKITDVALRKIFTGEDDRLLLVIGPCSADREDSVLDYISRLRTVQEKVADKILIAPSARPEQLAGYAARPYSNTQNAHEGDC